MGKWTDKLYITRTECASGDHFGAKAAQNKQENIETTHTIDICSLSLLPWDKPVCNLDGAVFDHLNALEAQVEGPLINLHFGPNCSCPITCKDLRGKGVRVVAIKSSGWVYEASVVEEICKSCPLSTWRDPMVDLPFSRSDIIHLQPRNTKPINNHTIIEQNTEPKRIENSPSNNNITHMNAQVTKKEEPLNLGIGRVTLRLNLGDMHFELDCKQQPAACEAFINAALQGHFLKAPIYRISNGSLFQAGRADQLSLLCKCSPSPPGTHNQRGLLGLVAIRAGRYAPHLYVTMGPTPALDGVNVVLGKVVAGWRTLEKLVDVPVKVDTCMPAVDCFIEDVIVVDNPFIIK